MAAPPKSVAVKISEIAEKTAILPVEVTATKTPPEVVYDRKNAVSVVEQGELEQQARSVALERVISEETSETPTLKIKKSESLEAPTPERNVRVSDIAPIPAAAPLYEHIAPIVESDSATEQSEYSSVNLELTTSDELPNADESTVETLLGEFDDEPLPLDEAELILAPEEPAVADQLPVETAETSETAPLTLETALQTFQDWLSETLIMQDLVMLEAAILPAASDEEAETTSDFEQTEMARPKQLLQDVLASLAELPAAEQEQTAPMLLEALAVAKYIQEISQADEPLISEEQATLRLTELCRHVLDTLAIEYDEDDIERLVGMLVATPVPSSIADETTDKISDQDGTHEHKHFTKLFNSQGKLGFSPDRLVGSLLLAGFVLV